MAGDPLSGPSIDGDQLRRKAATSAADAVRADTAGDLATSALLYEEAAEALHQLLNAGLASVADKQSIEGRIKEYKLRAEELKTADLAKSIPSVPKTTPSPAPPKPKDPPPPVTSPKSAPVSDSFTLGDEQGSLYPDISEAAAANDTSGTSAAEAGASVKEAEGTKSASVALSSLQSVSSVANKVQEFEAKYQVGSTVYSAAKGTYEAVRDAETNYHISEKITDGVKSTVASARKLEEDYQLSQKVAEAGSKASEAVVAAARRAQELEAQHEIRDRVALALKEGWESLKYAGETLTEYEREYQLRERIQDALYQGYEQASEYYQQTVQYWRQAPPSLPYPSLPANSDV